MGRQPHTGTPGEIHAEFTFAQPLGEPTPTPRTAMRVALLGDFTGREGRAGASAAAPPARARSFDIDTLDDLPGRMGVEIALAQEGAGALAAPIGSIDDLHPDRLLARVPIFAELLDVRRRLRDPATFAQAAAEVKAWSGAPGESPAPAKQHTSAEQRGGNDLASLLGTKRDDGRNGASSAHAEAARSAEALIRSLVRPHIVDDPDPRQAELVEQVERGVSEQLRRVLRDPAFQRVEANWRSAQAMAETIEPEQGVSLSILDATKRELFEDLAGAEDPDATALGRALTDLAASDGGAWTLLVCLFRVEPTEEDAVGLLRAARRMQRVGGALTADASPLLFGCAGPEQLYDPAKWGEPGDEQGAWAALRRRPEAGRICLTAPRLLLRLPYGAATDPIDSIPFEEAPGSPPTHDAYLWGEGGTALARALASLFIEHERFVYPPGVATIGGLPAHTWTDSDGEPAMTPCAEAWLSERATREIESSGVTPIASVRGRDAAQLHPPRSLAGGRLLGPWG